MKGKVAMAEFEIKKGILKKYNGSGGDVVIPDGVTKIGNGAFWGCKYLTKVIIPDSVQILVGMRFMTVQKQHLLFQMLWLIVRKTL